jgi:hypothetical protein
VKEESGSFLKKEPKNFFDFAPDIFWRQKSFFLYQAFFTSNREEWSETGRHVLFSCAPPPASPALDTHPRSI